MNEYIYVWIIAELPHNIEHFERRWITSKFRQRNCVTDPWDGR